MALPADSPAYVSPEEYLRRERLATEKHEYFNGEIRAMAGASYAHNKVTMNMTLSLGSQLRGKPCTPLGSDQRVHVKNESSFLYPDLSVVCGEPKFSEKRPVDTLLNPVLIVEVLSPSTKTVDRGDKFMLYRQIASLRQYLMLESKAVHAELYTLDEATGHWIFSETRDPAAVLDLGSVGASLPLTELYQGVPLEA